MLNKMLSKVLGTQRPIFVKVGPVSAYALAKKHGYTGSEEQWATEQANAGKYASDAKAAQAGAETAKGQADAAVKAAEGEVAKATAEADRADAAANRAECRIDNAVIAADKAWASKETVDRLASPFVQKASIVQGELVAVYPMTVKSYIEPVQEGTGDPSPENVRPIHGVTELQAVSCGKNLIDQNIELNWVDKVNVTAVKKEDGSIHVTANGKQSDTQYINISKINYSDESIKSDKPNRDGLISSENVAFDARNKYTFIIVRPNEQLDRVFYPQIEKASAATEYEPYHGKTFTQTLPEEIMGGVYEWDTGKLVVTHRKDVNSVNNLKASPGYETTPFFVNMGLKPGTIAYCDVLKIKSVVDGKGNVTFMLDIPLDQFKSKYPSLQITVVGETNEPRIIQLSKHLILSQPGITTVYSSAGDTEVTARKDPNAERAQMQRDIAALQKAQTNL